MVQSTTPTRQIPAAGASKITSQQLLDELVGAGRDRDAVVAAIEALVGDGSWSVRAAHEAREVVWLSEAEVAAITSAVIEAASAQSRPARHTLAVGHRTVPCNDLMLPTEADPFVGRCPTWCQHVAGGHPVTRYAAARVHVSTQRTVELELEPLIELPDGHGYLPTRLSAFLLRHYRETEPRLWLGDADWSTDDDLLDNLTGGSSLTLDEAERLATALLALVQQGRGGPDEPAAVAS